MNFLQRRPVGAQPSESSAEPSTGSEPADGSLSPVPLTRTGAAWVGVSAGALVAILLIIFMVQNTHQVQVDFLGMSTSTSLALMLLIAAVGGILLTVIVGTARIVQLRRIIRGRAQR